MLTACCKSFSSCICGLPPVYLSIWFENDSPSNNSVYLTKFSTLQHKLQLISTCWTKIHFFLFCFTFAKFQNICEKRQCWSCVGISVHLRGVAVSIIKKKPESTSFVCRKFHALSSIPDFRLRMGCISEPAGTRPTPAEEHDVNKSLKGIHSCKNTLFAHAVMTSKKQGLDYDTLFGSLSSQLICSCLHFSLHVLVWAIRLGRGSPCDCWEVFSPILP